MEQINSKTVFVVMIDYTKDLSDAKKYGELRAVFSKPRKPYNTTVLINKARRVLEAWQPGDYLLMVGDPTLCAVCMAIISEYVAEINVLSWDRDTFQYLPTTWYFDGQQSFDFEDSATADD